MFQNITNRIYFALSAILALTFTSCSLIYEDTTECYNNQIRVKLQVSVKTDESPDSTPVKAEKFYAETKCASVYVFDASGKFVTTSTKEGDKLKQDDYTMDIPLGEGSYYIVALTGLDDPNYIASQLAPGVSTIDDLKVQVKRDANKAQNNNLTPIWQGMTTERLDITPTSGKNVCVNVYVRKLTNRIVALFEHMSGDAMVDSDYTYELKADNGTFGAWGNVLPDDTISYGAYYQNTVSLDSISVARAELNTLRLMADKKTRFVVTDKATSQKILDINLTKYLLLTKSMFDEQKGMKLTDQQYLDYEDEYSIIFFMDTNNHLIQISINGWIIRVNDAKL